MQSKTGHSGQETERRPFNERDRERFRGLLALAAESPFEGERRNALAAATRMAERHGMTLEEAASPHSGDPEPEVFQGYRRAYRQPRPEPKPEPRPGKYDDPAFWARYTDQQQKSEKARWEEALKDAHERGLDRKERERAKRDGIWRRPSDRKQPPHRHARILLTETSLPFREIADITGLDLYEVVGLKLKLREN